jgi:hypothetical protein
MKADISTLHKQDILILQRHRLRKRWHSRASLLDSARRQIAIIRSQSTTGRKTAFYFSWKVPVVLGFERPARSRILSPKRIIFKDRSRQALLKGAKRLAEVVKVTYGPMGRHVMIGGGSLSPRLTKDGRPSREVSNSATESRTWARR